jgi:hypothetical protein
MSAAEVKKVRDLIARFNSPVPFGDKTNWEKFGKLYISCHILVDLISEFNEYQKKILHGIISGKCEVEIWNTVFSLLETSGNAAGIGRIIKALCDGSMEVYGYSEITFDNLEKQIENFVKEAGSNKDHPICQNKFDIYNYRVNLSMIDSQTQTFMVSVTLYQMPSDSQFADITKLLMGKLDFDQSNQTQYKIKSHIDKEDANDTEDAIDTETETEDDLKLQYIDMLLKSIYDSTDKDKDNDDEDHLIEYDA